MESAPRTGRSSPESESSPKNSASCGRALISPAAARMDSRMGRSKAVPALRVSAGARLTVRRDTGQSNEQDFAAARTRSPASLTAPVGSPTTSSRGSPPESRHSTVTKYARDHARSILSEGSCASSVEQKPLYRINIPYHSPFHNTKTVGLHRKNGWKNGICFTMQNGLSKNEKTSEKNGFCCLQSFASVIQ